MTVDKDEGGRGRGGIKMGVVMERGKSPACLNEFGTRGAETLMQGEHETFQKLALGQKTPS